MTVCWILSSGQCGHRRRGHPYRTEPIPTITALYIEKRPPREEKGAPLGQWGQWHPPPLGLHPTPHPGRICWVQGLQAWEGGRCKSPVFWGEHLPPSQEDQRIQGGPAGLVHPAGKHSFKVSLAGPGKPLTLGSLVNPKQNLEPHELGIRCFWSGLLESTDFPVFVSSSGLGAVSLVPTEGRGRGQAGGGEAQGDLCLGHVLEPGVRPGLAVFEPCP